MYLHSTPESFCYENNGHLTWDARPDSPPDGTERSCYWGKYIWDLGEMCYLNSNITERDGAEQMNVVEYFCSSHSTLNLYSLGSNEEKSTFLPDPLSFFFWLYSIYPKNWRSLSLYLIDSSCQLRTSLSDIFFRKIPFFWMLRLLAAKFSKSVKVPADRVEWILADTERVEPEIFSTY